eukprot:TRINITY_DN665_c0_g2_i1.p1 TRINITY_DN665_c0_g2~~TRINITY_DN665_c0_g2_i1.p1  ORF type:complete len:347 (+),score=81.31 TRINITY_DN665_c0_g2_i1:310-1350(+)
MQKPASTNGGKLKKSVRKDDGSWSDDDDDQTEVQEIPVHGSEEAPHDPHASEVAVDADGKKTEKDPVLFTQTPSAVARAKDMKARKKYPIHMREHVKTGGMTRYQSSSTSTLFVNSTPSAPDINDVLQSMATALYMHISSGHRVAEPKFIDIFNEEKYPISKGNDTEVMPRIKIIYKFITTIFRVEKLPPECAILCLAYIERLISVTGLTLHASNWRRVLLAALILASKVWEDQAVWNVDFLSVFPSVTVQDLRVLEKRLLAYLEYNVNVTGGLYAKYYFELRELTEKDNKRFSLQPLDKVGIERLEARANYLEDSVRKKRMRKAEMVRSSSSDALPVKSPKVILS